MINVFVHARSSANTPLYGSSNCEHVVTFYRPECHTSIVGVPFNVLAVTGCSFFHAPALPLRFFISSPRLALPNLFHAPSPRQYFPSPYKTLFPFPPHDHTLLMTENHADCPRQPSRLDGHHRTLGKGYRCWPQQHQQQKQSNQQRQTRKRHGQRSRRRHSRGAVLTVLRPVLAGAFMPRLSHRKRRRLAVIRTESVLTFTCIYLLCLLPTATKRSLI